ncbi:DUF461 domain-containing protein [Streptomyces pathocidini]|uniref:DUF461 domain-containing protein n=1 Tax=Streptomyces pathocidini TaxID=1650571 RepID=UPI0034043158
MSLPRTSAGGAPILRRGALAAAAVVASVASLSACAAGNSASTLQVKPDNAATSIGDVKIQNANVITQPEGAEGPAVVAAKIFNNGQKEQTLDSITVEGLQQPVKLAPAKGSGSLTIPAGGTLILGGEGNASAQIANSSESFRDGDVQRVVFKLSETGEVPLTAFVVPATHYFKDFGPSSVPTPSKSASPSGSPTEEAGAANGEHETGATASTGAGQSPAAGHSSAAAGH